MRASSFTLVLVTILFFAVERVWPFGDELLQSVRCSENEVVKRNAGGCDECRCRTDGGSPGVPEVCTSNMVTIGCFCEDGYCRTTTEPKKCVRKDACE
ncbi:hypothetical protein MTO96_034229 [Rhipicephalus appendiculatus]